MTEIEPSCRTKWLPGQCRADHSGAWRLLSSSRLACGRMFSCVAACLDCRGTKGRSGLSASVTIARDAQGVPTVVGRTRSDLVFALGYLHAQERFFQMGCTATERGWRAA